MAEGRVMRAMKILKKIITAFHRLDGEDLSDDRWNFVIPIRYAGTEEEEQWVAL